MKIEDQCCNLEQAKRLKELGVKQDSYFSWCGGEKHIVMDSNPMAVKKRVWVGRTEPANNMEADHRDDVPGSKPFAAAFTVAELGVMLPLQIKKDTVELTLYKWRRNDGLWFIHYSYILLDSGKNKYLIEESITHYNEAEACAGMLIYLLENKILTL